MVTTNNVNMTRNGSIARITLSLSFIALLFISFNGARAQEIPTDPANISNGESLFKANCKTCHSVQNQLVGPALKNVYDRTPSIEWIFSFVKNSQKVIKSGDEYAVNLYNEFNQTEMTAFDSFSNEEILDILAYVKDQTDNPPVAAVATTSGGEGAAQAESAVPSYYLNIIIIALIIVLVLILVVLVLITTVLTRYINNREISEEDQEVVDQKFSIVGALTSKPGMFLIIFIFTALMFKVVINGLYSVGVQKGYQPKQPIAFSHKIHAGQYEIDCNYCHTGVMKSKNANIPSPNICMNCHSQIKKGTNTGEGEIAKIYAAVENNTPIEWVRIHNLPDLAYFNHSQHVNVGGIECQTCHGPIEEMDVVKQHSLLTMGWCVDCHRTTELNTQGNEYYDKLVELHEKEGKGAMTVEDNGGLECAKCHY